MLGLGFLFWVWGFGVFPFCLRHIPATRISLKLTFAACVFAKNSRCTPVSLIRFSRHDRGTGVGTGVAVGGLPDTADVSHCRYRGRCGRRWCRHSRGLTAKVRQPPISSPALRPFTAAQVVLDLSDLPTFSPPISPMMRRMHCIMAALARRARVCTEAQSKTAQAARASECRVRSHLFLFLPKLFCRLSWSVFLRTNPNPRETPTSCFV